MRHFLDLNAVPADDLRAILTAAAAMKAARAGQPRGVPDAEPALAGQVVALVFEKPSTRTRVSFDVGVRQMGGETLVLSGSEMQLGHGETIAERNKVLVDHLHRYDAVIIAGQAKSHCVAWTIADLLAEVQERDLSLAPHVFLLEDCTSPVVVPGVIDYTDEADAAFRRFAEAGFHVVRSTDPLSTWPGLDIGDGA